MPASDAGPVLMPDAGSTQVADAALEAGAQDASDALGACEASSDCALALVKCCASCPPVGNDLIAVRVEERASVYQRDCPTPGVMCGACPPYQGPEPRFYAECESGQCTVAVSPTTQ
jgi:hypothetical protein